uniref:Uncharacterized protein n=1 Tax=Chromera velia CCMP2878 TaxID=1169474 RepID=A0A0K6S956_9ALVE|eukprot:Cvel_1109.t3-p1 / transcript=Cvel_1109.t3 / gene=Cvel_1109 / organism=Chromera_velia_CCMP2878 / gene_product=hypothetical protein / transcript_product=hypothetical protein / location=Cvel_scaffold36:102074-105752(+) / protein_length=711 / sequence_SO=supercontig / SO=protein_coding / is_pseudo=false
MSLVAQRAPCNPPLLTHCSVSLLWFIDVILKSSNENKHRHSNIYAYPTQVPDALAQLCCDTVTSRVRENRVVRQYFFINMLDSKRLLRKVFDNNDSGQAFSASEILAQQKTAADWANNMETRSRDRILRAPSALSFTSNPVLVDFYNFNLQKLLPDLYGSSDPTQPKLRPIVLDRNSRQSFPAKEAQKPQPHTEPPVQVQPFPTTNSRPFSPRAEVWEKDKKRVKELESNLRRLARGHTRTMNEIKEGNRKGSFAASILQGTPTPPPQPTSLQQQFARRSSKVSLASQASMMTEAAEDRDDSNVPSESGGGGAHVNLSRERRLPSRSAMSRQGSAMSVEFEGFEGGVRVASQRRGQGRNDSTNIEPIIAVPKEFKRRRKRTTTVCLNDKLARLRKEIEASAVEIEKRKQEDLALATSVEQTAPQPQPKRKNKRSNTGTRFNIPDSVREAREKDPIPPSASSDLYSHAATPRKVSANRQAKAAKKPADNLAEAAAAAAAAVTAVSPRRSSLAGAEVSLALTKSFTSANILSRQATSLGLKRNSTQFLPEQAPDLTYLVGPTLMMLEEYRVWREARNQFIRQHIQASFVAYHEEMKMYMRHLAKTLELLKKWRWHCTRMGTHEAARRNWPEMPEVPMAPKSRLLSWDEPTARMYMDPFIQLAVTHAPLFSSFLQKKGLKKPPGMNAIGRPQAGEGGGAILRQGTRNLVVDESN